MIARSLFIAALFAAAPFESGSALAANVPTTPPAAKAAGKEAGQPAAIQPPTLVLRGLDKITGRPTNIMAPIGKPVAFATLTITARSCYSTPPSETPETAAFVQIDDHRPDKPPRRVFSGWMYASSPGLNAMEHPLYDVWVITCRTNAPGEASVPVASTAPVKVLSPDSTDNEGLAPLPEDAGQ